MTLVDLIEHLKGIAATFGNMECTINNGFYFNLTKDKIKVNRERVVGGLCGYEHQTVLEFIL